MNGTSAAAGVLTGRQMDTTLQGAFKQCAVFSPPNQMILPRTPSSLPVSIFPGKGPGAHTYPPQTHNQPLLEPYLATLLVFALPCT